MFWVTRGNCVSTVDRNGTECVTDGPGDYGPNERCVIAVLRSAVVDVPTGGFATASSLDNLTYTRSALVSRRVDISRSTVVETFSGSGGRTPDGVYVPRDALFTWATDGDTAATAVGFTLCAAPTGPIAVRPGVSFYPVDLPVEIQANTLPQFASALAGDTAQVTLRRAVATVLHRFSSPDNVVFSVTLTNHTSAAVTTGRFVNIDSSTGAIIVFHDSADIGASFVYDVIATDTGRLGDGRSNVIYTWNYTVVGAAPLIRTAAPFELDLDGVPLNEAALPVLLAIGQQYRFAGPAADPTVPRSVTNARFFQNVQGQVAYTIEASELRGPPPPDGDVLINTATGSLFITPTAQFDATYELSAFDESGRPPIVVMRWSFRTLEADVDEPSAGPNGRGCTGGTPVDGVPFDGRFTCNCSSDFTGENCETQILPQLIVDYHGSVAPPSRRQRRQTAATPPCSVISFTPTARTKWALGRAYSIDAANVTSARTSSGAIVPIVNVTYQLLPNPPGFFIDSATGSILGQPVGAFNGTSELKAVVFGTAPATLTTLHFEFLPADVDDPANGPNGAGCGEGGTEVDDIEFDGAFRCDCIDAFVGDNCETQVIPQLLVDYHGTPPPSPGSLVDFTPITRTKWAIGRTYQVNVANITNPRTANATFDVDDVTFQLLPNPPGFFIDGDTAAFIGQPAAPLNVTSVLRGVVDGTLPANLTTIVFEFLPADVDVPANGPGGAACLNGGTPVDLVEFDNAFTCDCSTTSGYVGANCEILSDLPALRVNIGMLPLLSLTLS